MDLYVEKQYVDKMREGDMRKFVKLYDSYFDDVYAYVVRRVNERSVANEIVKAIFLEALKRVNTLPDDVSFLTWLYSLSKIAVWNYLDRAGFPGKKGLIYEQRPKSEDVSESQLVLSKFTNLFKKLSLEESEILRLKFFEELADSDLQIVLGSDENNIGTKIYRVLKRAHFLLFGESDQRQGVYFGELSGFLQRVKKAEFIDVPEDLKMSLRSELSLKIDKKDFAVDIEAEQKDAPEPVSGENERAPFKEINERQGSDDPAKIFVEAVKEMREEEKNREINNQLKMEQREQMLRFLDRWKFVLASVPAMVFVLLVAAVFYALSDGGKVERGFYSSCGQALVYEGNFNVLEKKAAIGQVAGPICDNFEVERVLLSRVDEQNLAVSVDAAGEFLEYGFVLKEGNWKMLSYAKTVDSDQKQGKVRRNP